MAELGINQAQLAERAGVTQPSVSRWMRGSFPEAQQLLGLARALDMTVDGLLTEALPLPDPTSVIPDSAEEVARRAREAVRREDDPPQPAEGDPPARRAIQ